MTDDLLPGTDPTVAGARATDEQHAHGDECGHEAIAHGDHRDFLHDGHRHAEGAGHDHDHDHDGGDATTGPDGAVATGGLSSRG